MLRCLLRASLFLLAVPGFVLCLPLSSVEYEITVVDTQTGDMGTYHNSRGQLASVADTSAF